MNPSHRQTQRLSTQTQTKDGHRQRIHTKPKDTSKGNIHRQRTQIKEHTQTKDTDKGTYTDKGHL